MTPQEIAAASAEAMWSTDRASQHLGMKIERIAPGEATLTMKVADFMLNGHGICHGGYIFLLADSAFAFACNTYNQLTVAQQVSIVFTAPGKPGDVMRAVAHEVSRTGRSGVYDITVTGGDGSVVAEFRGLSRTIKGTHVPGLA